MHADAKTPLPTVSAKSFFEDIAPERMVLITKASHVSGQHYYLTLPEIELHCESETCSGVRLHKSQSTVLLEQGRSENQFIKYVCKNCGSRQKTYAVRVTFPLAFDDTATCFKLGENPSFGPPPSRQLSALVEGERDLFLKGRRCEMQGLGIGAFSYYRRMVEGIKNRLLDRMIEACKRTPSTEEIVKELEHAKTIREFSRATEAFKSGIPDSLLIGSHNPLTLLHNALSVGLHALTDVECLERAIDVRIVLDTLAEKLAYALKDDKQLNVAVSRLQKMPSVKPPTDAAPVVTAPDTALSAASSPSQPPTQK